MNPKHPLNDPDLDEYRCQPVMRFPVGSSAELLYFPLKKVARVVTPPEAKLLGACGQFAALDSHAKQIADSLPTGRVDPDGVMEILRAFVADGMMLSRAELLKHLASLPRPQLPPRIAWLAIPTCDRPELLRRALKSYARHFSRTGRFPKLLVADDSRAPEASRASKEAVDEQAESWGAAVVYSGPEEKRRLVDRIAGDGSIPKDVLEFGILGPGGDAPTFGANRNTILLQTAGEMILSADDDTICEPCAAPETDPLTLRLGGEGDPAEFWFFPDRQSALAFVRTADINVLRAHEALLGRHVWSLAEQGAGGGEVDLHSACGHLIEDIWTGAGRILLTLNGSVGDSGILSSRPFLTYSNPATRRRLVASEEAYQSALHSREVARQTLSASVGHGGPFIGMFFGVDNRGLLPPFLPVGRDEDGTIGHVLRLCLKGCYFGYLPWALAHDPPGARTYPHHGAAAVSVSVVVSACISEWSPVNRCADTACCLHSLGRHLLEVTSMAAGDFGDFIRATLWRQIGQGIARMDALLRHDMEKPEYWAAGLRREIEAAMTSLAGDDFGAPYDLPGPSGAARLRFAQGLARQYGELLCWWPEIRARVDKLK